MTARQAPPRPEVIDPQPYAVPLPTRAQLANGLTVLTYDVPGQYVLSVRLVVPLPLRVEPREVEGVALIMARTLDEGSTSHTATELARLLERRGVALGAGVGDSALHVEVDLAQRHLAYGLELMRECLADPVFPESEVQRHVQTRLAEIEQERSIAAHRAAMELGATFFDRTSRASRPAGGTPDTVSAITPEQVRAFHRRWVAPIGATVVVAGDLSGVDVLGILDQTVGRWETPAEHEDPGPWQPMPLAPDRRRIVVVDRPESVQTELMVACPGPDRHVASGWAPYPVLSFVIGGSPTARLDTLLREDKGYTYGMRSSFRPRRVDGWFIASGSVRSEVTVDALRDLMTVLDGAREGFTQEEAEAGRQFLVRTAPSRYATADTLADEAASLALDGLDTSFTNDTLAQIAAMTPERLTASYRDSVDGEWTVVLVGDAAAIVEPLREAFGRVDVVAN